MLTVFQLTASNSKAGDFGSSQTVISHEVQDGVVASAQIVASVHRGQQLFNKIPANGARRQFTTIGSRRVYAIRSPRAVSPRSAQKRRKARRCACMLQRLAPNLTGRGLDEDFDMFGCKRRKRAGHCDGRRQKGIDRYQMLPDRCRSQSPSHPQGIADIAAAIAQPALSALLFRAVLLPLRSGDILTLLMRHAGRGNERRTLPAIWLRSVFAHIEGAQMPRGRSPGGRHDDALQHECIPLRAASGQTLPVRRRSASFH